MSRYSLALRTIRLPFAISVSILLLAALAAGAAPPAAVMRVAAGSAVRPATALAGPMLFEPNQGQTDARARYLSRGSGYVLFLTREGMRLRTAQRRGEAAVLGLRLLGAKAVTPAGLEPSASRANYFVGANPAAWRRNVPEYRRVSYGGVYPGVDLVYYGRQGQLEYDFNVAPGARTEAIRFAVAGAGQSAITPAGDLRMSVGGAEFTLRRPVAYQMVNGARRRIAVRYYRDGDAIGFRLGAYDHGRALVIDPVLSFATYLGGTGNDQANAVAADSAGDAYVAGFTLSTDFPVTTGVVQGAAAGSFDAFVAEVDPTGAKLIFSTYLGGGSDDEANGIAVDKSGNIFVAGVTQSSNFPVSVGARQATLAGGKDGFVAKLAAGGASLAYSTYLGGTSDDEINAIALDTNGNAWVAGDTLSSNFPVSATSPQATFGGKQDAFVAEISPKGTGLTDLVFSTYLGGSANDKATGIALDGSGNVYVAGLTSSSNFPVTAAALQTTLGGSFDAFVAKLSSTGVVQYATYLGGAGDDEANALAVDAAGDAFVTGFTTSTNFPATPGAYRTQLSAASDVFVTELNRSGSAAVYSTYVGGSASDAGTGVALDGAGNAYVTGFTSSNDFPVTATASQAQIGGNNDGFLIKLNAIGSQLQFSSFLGGTGVDEANAITIDAGGDIFVAGVTGSGDFPVTTGVLQSTPASAQDAFLVKFITAAIGSFAPNPLSFPAQSVGSISAAEGVQLTNAGELNLAISKIAVTGPFAQTNNCPGSLVPGASCAIQITFAPGASGAASGTLVVTDSAPGGSQTMNLTGTGGDFSFSVTPTTSTVTAGSTTSYQLTVTPANGYTQVVKLTCSGAPTGTTCTPSPTSLTMNGTTASNAVFTVSTSAGAVPPGPFEGPGSPWWFVLLGLLGISALAWLLWGGSGARRARRRWALAGAAGLLLMTMAWVGCGSSTTTSPKTPAGTYTLTFSGAAGSTTHTITVTLTVNN